jgi:hypothetical protein
MDGPRLLRRAILALLGLALVNVIVVTRSAGADPTLTVSPKVSDNTGPVTLTITTTNPHVPGATKVRLRGPAPGGIDTYDDAAPVVSGMTITATVDLAPKGVPAGPGSYTVEVCDGDCDENVGSLGVTETFSPFKVAGTPPTAVAMTPSAIGTGVTGYKTDITGSYFSKSSKVTFTIPGTKESGGVSATTVQTMSASQLAVTVSSLANATPGPRDVTVTSTDGQATTISQGLIVNAAPAAVRAEPNGIGQGAVKFPVLLTGRNFADGAVVTVMPEVGPANDPAVDSAVQPDGGVVVTQGEHGSTSIPLQVTVTPGAPAGGRRLVVRNPDGGTAAASIMINAAPTFANTDPTNPVTATPSVSPGARGQGSPSTTVTVIGEGFRPGAVVDFGNDITTGAATVAADGKTVSVAGVQVSSLASAGRRNVDVVNGDGGRATCVSCFEVTKAPTVASVQPASLGRAASGQFVQLAGTGFTSTMTVAVQDLTVNSVKYISATAATVSLSVPAAATPGLKKFTTRNADGGSAVCPTCFSVDTFPVSKTSPETATNLRPVTITATGSKIPLNVVGTLTLQQQVPGQGTITATGSEVSSTGTSYTGTFNLDGAAPGEYLLRLTSSAGTGTCACTFTVVGGQPTVTEASPAVITQGTAGVKVTLRGTNLAGGAVISFPSGSGVFADAARTTVVSSERIDTLLMVDQNATVGPVQVSVTNNDKKSATCAACLSVQRGPAITAVSPDKLPQGANKQTVTVTGQNLPTEVELDFGPGVTVEGRPSVSGGTITAVVDVSATAPAGARSVVLTDPHGATARCDGCFTVLATSTTPGLFFPVDPARVLDTRSTRAVVAGSDRALKVAGVAGVPADASAVVLNVTVTAPLRPGKLAVYPSGASTGTSSLNFSRGQTIANAVTVKVGSSGAVMLGVSAGSAHVVVDVFGYFRQADSGATFTPLQPARVLDTRTTGQPVAAGSDRQVRVAGDGSVPADASAVVLNVTVVRPSSAGHLTVYPTGSPSGTSSLNFPAGATVPNLVTVKVGDLGSVSLRLARGSANAVVDVFGYYAPGLAGSTFSAVTPARILDTRSMNAPLRRGQSRVVEVSGLAGVPSDAKAVVLNVTATASTSAGHLSVYPNGERTDTSNLNFTAGQTVPNMVVVGLGPDGDVAMETAASSTHAVVDVFGFYR